MQETFTLPSCMKCHFKSLKVSVSQMTSLTYCRNSLGYKSILQVLMRHFEIHKNFSAVNSERLEMG